MNPGIAVSIAAIGIFCLTLGLSYPLLALILDSMGISTGLIGLNAAMAPLGIIVSSPFMPSLAMSCFKSPSVGWLIVFHGKIFCAILPLEQC